MTKTQDLSSYASFDIDDIVAEIGARKKSHKEVTAYLDRNFLVNMINEYHRQSKLSTLDFTAEKQIDISEYNFSGADFRGIKIQDFELFNFYDCDITSVHLDRDGIAFFREYILSNQVIFQSVNLEGAYLGPLPCIAPELGIKCSMHLDLSNLDLTGSNFHNCDIEGLILENTNISSCDFSGAQNLDPKQFAFSINFEQATFSQNSENDKAIKAKIKYYSEKLNSNNYYDEQLHKSNHGLVAHLAKITNFLGD